MIDCYRAIDHRGQRNRLLCRAAIRSLYILCVLLFLVFLAAASKLQWSSAQIFSPLFVMLSLLAFFSCMVGFHVHRRNWRRYKQSESRVRGRAVFVIEPPDREWRPIAPVLLPLDVIDINNENDNAMALEAEQAAGVDYSSRVYAHCGDPTCRLHH